MAKLTPEKLLLNADIEKIASALVRKINEQRIITNG